MSNQTHTQDGQSFTNQIEKLIKTNKKNWEITLEDFVVDPSFHVHPELLICEAEETGYIKVERRSTSNFYSISVVKKTEFTPEFRLIFQDSIGLSATISVDDYTPNTEVVINSSIKLNCQCEDSAYNSKINQIAMKLLQDNSNLVKRFCIREMVGLRYLKKFMREFTMIVVIFKTNLLPRYK